MLLLHKVLIWSPLDGYPVHGMGGSLLDSRQSVSLIGACIAGG